MDWQATSLYLAAVLARTGQGLVPQQEATRELMRVMQGQASGRSMTRIPMPELIGEGRESPNLRLRNIKYCLSTTFPDGNPDAEGAMSMALKGSACEWFTLLICERSVGRV